MASLYLVATPIGNRDDITIRALKTLFTVPVIVAEDTRNTGKLLQMYRTNPLLESLGLNPNHKPIFLSCSDEAEASRVKTVVNYLQSGLDVAVVSDAGTPVVSDPGYKIARAASNSGFRIVPIPGPSSVWTALIASQQPPASVYYCGFLPTKQRARSKFFLELSSIVSRMSKPCTVVAFESPYRLISTLNDLASVYGSDFPLTIARELTKIHEQIETQPVSYWLQNYSKYPPKGEFTLCFVPLVSTLHSSSQLDLLPSPEQS